jgi:hypothetical protein
MQVQNRLVSVPTRQISLAATLVAVVALLALVLFAGNFRHVQQATTDGGAVVVNQQAPDAQERNDAYSQALAARFKNQSADAQERNIQLSRR